MTGTTVKSVRARDYRCSFCGKSQDKVKRLIAGPHSVFICNECIDLCYEIVHEEEDIGALAGQQEHGKKDQWRHSSRSGQQKKD